MVSVWFCFSICCTNADGYFHIRNDIVCTNEQHSKWFEENSAVGTKMSVADGKSSEMCNTVVDSVNASHLMEFKRPWLIMDSLFFLFSVDCCECFSITHKRLLANIRSVAAQHSTHMHSIATLIGRECVAFLFMIVLRTCVAIIIFTQFQFFRKMLVSRTVCVCV